MRRIIIALGILLLTTSCIGSFFTRAENNGGYPRKITMPKEGGSVVVDGDMQCWGFTFVEKGDTERSVDKDGDIEIRRIKRDWLTVEFEFPSYSATIIAEPSYSDKKRSLTVESTNAYDYIEIKVVQ